MPSPLTRRPETRAISIEDLLDRVRRGEVRIPEFQRPLKWTASDVRDLFDSVYRGYPIGTLLFWKREAPAASVTFGPVRIDAPSTSQALWVVDGQQRITALAGVLLRSSSPSPAPDDFALYFDLEKEELAQPPGGAPPPAHWLPLNVVLDSEQLLNWLDRYPERAKHPEHTRAAIRLGKALREYQVPANIVEAADEKTLRIIFKRMNTSGKPLTQDEVFNALYSDLAGARTPNLRALSENLRTLGFGTLGEALLLQAVLAVRGLDFLQDFQRQLREEDDLSETLRHTEPALRDAIVFLKRDAGVPHLALVPEPVALVLLARFFHLHPEPTPRSRELLSRWFWRGSVLGRYWDPKVPDAHRFLTSAPGGEEQAVQAMLAQVRKPAHRGLTAFTYAMPHLAGLLPATDPVALNALLALHPRHLLTGEPLDAVRLLEEPGATVPSPLLTEPPEDLPSEGSPLAALPNEFLATVANHLFHPPLPDRPLLDVLGTQPPPAPDILRSHALTPPLLAPLHVRQPVRFLAQRQQFLGAHIVEFVRAHTRWDETDRPSLQSMIIDDEED